MNSIKIAEKLIEENDKDIEYLRESESIIRKRIEEYKRRIESHELRIEHLRRALAMAEEDLQRTQDNKNEYLVDNLALKRFVAEGGGLDMFVD